MVCVIGYFMLGGHRLLPERAEPPSEVEDKLQKGLFELKVAVQSPLIRQTVEEAGYAPLRMPIWSTFGGQSR